MIQSLGVAHPLAPPGTASLVETQLARLTEPLRVQPRVTAVVLLGSAARGELSAATVDGKLELFSDLELLAVTDGRLSASERRALNERVAATARGFRYRSPLFHTEVLFRERSRLATMPPLVFTFEARHAGRTLWGPELLEAIRPVGPDSLDRRNTHEILMKRLWALAEAVPASWVAGRKMGDIESRTLGVSTARNALDVPTVLLPEAGVLLAGYGRRVSHWAAHHQLPFRHRIDAAAGGDSASYLTACLAARRVAQSPADPQLAHERCVAVLRGALAWLLGVEDDAVAGRVVEASSSLFHEGPISIGEILGLLRQWPTLAAAQGVPWAVRWATGPRKGLLTSALLHLHDALDLHLAGHRKEAASALARAQGSLAALDVEGAAPAKDDGFPAAWLSTRWRTGRCFWRAVRLGQPLAWSRMAAALRGAGDGAKP